MIDIISQEELDRAVYNRIRLAVVEAGFLPDKFSFASNPAGYANAKATLGNNLIEVFGVGSTVGRDDLKGNRITVNLRTVTPGDLGGYPATQFVPYQTSGGKTRFTKSYLPDLQSDVMYDIRCITSPNTAVAQRKVCELVRKALGIRNYLPIYDNSGVETGVTYLMYRSQELDVTSTIDFKETLMSYVASGIWLQDGELVEGTGRDLAQLEQITFTYVEKEGDTSGLDHVIVP